ncbi:MAG TPA: DNA repair protein RecN [Candidatus Gallacutalibacter stercoravium]|nr:DNA repair protein RecN [Candidatus Gallacutalibacter stercoravium]
MLSSLYIENIAVIEKCQIDFSRGFTVLTGETGAGKSIVIDAINAVLGQRIARDMIRTGAASAYVSAVFNDISPQACQVMEQLGYQLEEDGTLLLQREISASSGKSGCRINGRPAPLSAVRELGACLLAIHGQNASLDLLDAQRHILYLDSMGELEPLRSEYQSAYRRMCRLREEYQRLNTDEAAKARRIDLLQYQIDELESAALEPGETERLTERKSVLTHAEKIMSALQEASQALNGEEDFGGALSLLEQAAGNVEAAARYYPTMLDTAQRLHNALYEVEDCAAELRSFADEVAYDPQELDEIEARLDVLYRLGQKYGETTEEMLDYLANAKQELEDISLSGEKKQVLKQQWEEAARQAEKLADTLSLRRKKVAGAFSQQVGQELQFLNMPGVSFQVSQQSCPLNSLGKDEVVFLISANPGEPPKPLSKIASGGELSRIMLAIKTVLADKDEIATLIFDEVDTGVSGGAAQKIGLKLKEVSHHRQVICVTHLAQIAALADRHLLIEKAVHDGRTFTQVRALDFAGRSEELARIIGGVQITELTLNNAAEMLRLAGIKETDNK